MCSNGGGAGTAGYCGRVMAALVLVVIFKWLCVTIKHVHRLKSSNFADKKNRNMY